MAGELASVDAVRGRVARTASATSPACTAPARSIPSSAPRGCGREQRRLRDADPARHPRDRPRGVPDGPRRLEGRDLPDSARLGRVVRSRHSSRRWRALIGESMRTLGIHQGLAPVLDVDPRPPLGPRRRVHRRGPLRRRHDRHRVRARPAGCRACDATLKHFVGYSASRAGRNHAPVSAGPREVADVLLPPFEMAVRDGGARSGHELLRRDRRGAGRRVDAPT